MNLQKLLNWVLRRCIELSDFVLVGFIVITASFMTVGCSKEGMEKSSAETEKSQSKLFPNNVLPCTDEQRRIIGGNFVLIRNVEYSNGLSADLYLPSDSWNSPVAIHIHGGGWTAGSRRTPMAEYWGELFACNGVAVFDVEYTLVPKADVYKQVKEIKCAILWTQTEGKEKYGIGDKILVFGGSAGGHLSALVSFSGKEIFPTESECEYVNKISFPNISATIHFYGVYDFTSGYAKYLKRYLNLHKLPEQELEKTFKEISPINYTQNVNFPVLLIHGDADFLPLTQSYLLYDDLKSKGKDVEIFVVEGGVHAFDVFPETNFTQKAGAKIIEFLRKHNFVKGESKKEVSQPSYQERMKRAYKFLEEGNFKHAFAEFSSAGEKNCETEYGKLIALSYDMLNASIASAQSGLLSYGVLDESMNINLNGISGPSSSRVNIRSEHPNWKADLNLYYENYVIPIRSRFDLIEELSQFVIQNSCTFYTTKGVPIYDNLLTTEIRIGKKFGKEFPLLAIAISQIIKFVLNFVFSHDLYFDVSAEKTSYYFIPYALETERENLPGLLRLGGILIEENRNLLKFHDERKNIFGEVKKNLSNSLNYLAKFLEESFLVNDDCDVLCWKDGNFFGIMEVVGNPGPLLQNMRFIESIMSLIVNQDYIRKVAGTLMQIKLYLDNNIPINFSIFRNFFPDIVRGFAENIFPDFISFNIGGFFDSWKPLRDFLPEVIYTDILPKKLLRGGVSELPVFLIEYELGVKAVAENFDPEPTRCFICPPGERFSNYDGRRTIEGKLVSKLADDGVALEGAYVFQSFGIPYVYYKDPTFGGNLYISSGDGVFRLPDQFLTNFAVARILSNLERIMNLLRR